MRSPPAGCRWVPGNPLPKASQSCWRLLRCEKRMDRTESERSNAKEAHQEAFSFRFDPFAACLTYKIAQ